MEYTVKKASMEELPGILEIYASARSFMARAGNPTQWAGGYPGRDLLEADIRAGDLYTLWAEGSLHGVFLFRLGEDPTYRIIEEGSWQEDSTYGVIHRVAGDGSGGILKAAVAFAEQQTDHLRIDTHRDNLPMQKALGNLGFHRRGVIYTEKGSPRIAFDRIRR